MKSKILFVFAVISFFNPIAVRADLGQMKTPDYKPGKTKCESYRDKKLAELQANNNATGEAASPLHGFVGSLTKE